jgi:DNA-binding NtrC family response regulator
MALLDHLNQAVARQLGHEPLVFAQAARARLQDYSFPGNIREMENLLKHLHITCATRAGAVAPEDLPPRLTQNLAEEQAALTLREAIHAHVRHVYALMGHNKSAAARALDISPNTLKKYL